MRPLREVCVGLSLVAGCRAAHERCQYPGGLFQANFIRTTLVMLHSRRPHDHPRAVPDQRSVKPQWMKQRSRGCIPLLTSSSHPRGAAAMATPAATTPSRCAKSIASRPSRLWSGIARGGGAAQRLGVSRRQPERLIQRYKNEGAAGLVSRKRGRPGNRPLVPGFGRYLKRRYHRLCRRTSGSVTDSASAAPEYMAP